eukprot:TRINITY_DN141_c0_g1_i1.p1 TRINITY_DN141_c0_g1~~TRINITY_DN141_c0_g1_i1.p1  ORF type:complete len:1151 (+),score=273.84 TRINITY_DN141_c0_g1_i1:170-3622(+)
MAGDEPDSRRKHRRSTPEEGAEEGSKRRKHHHSHRHHHHRSHRHRSSKHDHSKLDGDDLPLPPPPPPPTLAISNSRPADDEKEEGEILDEEEEEEYGGKRVRLAKAVDSDVESGEIKPDESMDEVSDLKAITAKSHVDQEEIDGEGDNSSAEVAEGRHHNLLLNGTLMRDSSYDGNDSIQEDLHQSHELLSVKNVGDEVLVNETSGSHSQHKTSKVHAEVEEQITWSRAELKPNKSKSRVEKDQIPPEDDEWGRQQESGLAPLELDTMWTVVKGDNGHKSYKGDPRCRGSMSPLKGAAGEETKFRDVEPSDSRRRMRYGPPVAGESSNSKHRKKDEHRNKNDHSKGIEDNSELSSVRYESKRHSESKDGIRNTLANRKRSISPESSKDKYKALRRSPSHENYHDEPRYHKRSRSRDHTRERSSLSRDVTHDRGFTLTVHSHEQSSKSYRDDNDREKCSDSLENIKNDSDSERGVRRDREDRHDRRDRSDIDRVIRRERERSRSYSRHDSREDRHGSRDRDIDRHRDKEWNREREMDRQRVRESESDRIREKERDRDRGRDRERYRDRDREMDENRISRHYKYGGVENSRLGRERYNDSRHTKYDESEHHRDKSRLTESNKEPSSSRHVLEEGKDTRDDEEEDYEERVMMKLVEQEEEDIDRIKEESRKRRQAILEKYKPQQSQLQSEPHSDDSGKEEKASSVDEKPGEHSSSPNPVANAVSKVLPDAIVNKREFSDADVADASFTIGKSPSQNGNSTPERNPGAGGLGDGTPKSERSTDMFCDDIFGESPAGVRKPGKGDGLQVERSGLHDNWDDAEGYYSYRFGEVLDGRYEITAAHGKGVFSTVVRAKDLRAGKGDPEEVAIKIIRNNETMYKAGQDELVILNKLAGADPEDKRHCVRFLSSFKYRNHLCLVFESLHMNLREVLKKFGRNIGLKLTAVRAYAKQLFIALKHLRNCGVLHCDIKPDNMLVNEAKNVLKLCDFGNAMLTGRNDITPYLVSRFYRAPEIILGLPYDHPLDIWSVGCCLYELYSGKVLFPGPTNNDMLRLHMELKGPFPKKMLKKGAFAAQHFDQDFNFHATEEDPVTKKTVKRLILNIKPKDMGSLITGSPGEDPKMLANFKDLLERVFILDPEKRMTVSQALSHPFITGK